MLFHKSIQYCKNKFFRLTLARRTICILRFVAAVHLDTLYSSDGRRNSCRCADKERKSAARVVPQSNTRRHIETRNVCLEAVKGSGRICSDLPWDRRRSRKTNDRPYTGHSRSTVPSYNCCDSRARTAPSCSSSSLRCSWCNSAWRRSRNRVGMRRIRAVSCRRYNPLGTRRDMCLQHSNQKPRMI